MTLAHLDIQASMTLNTFSSFFKATSAGDPAMCYQHSPFIPFLPKEKLAGETGRVLTEDQICRVTRNPGSPKLFPFPSISSGRSPAKAQAPHTNDRIQPVETGKLHLSWQKDHKGICQRSEVFLRFLLNFLSHVQSMWGLIHIKSCFYFEGMGGRSRCIDWLSVQPERDAVKRIMHKDFTIFFGANGTH